MKRVLCIFTLFAAVPFLISAKPPAKSKGAAPTLIVTPGVYIPGAPIEFSGSGYAPNTTELIDVQGSVAQILYASTDANGNFDLLYSDSTGYAPGYYIVSVYEISRKTATFMATSGFEVGN